MSGQALRVMRVNFSIGLSAFSSSSSGRTSVRSPGDRGGGHHGGRHQMRARARALPAAEIAVSGRGAALTRGDQIAVDADAHRATGFAPFEAGVAKDCQGLPLPPDA